MLVHGEQFIELHGPIPAEGTVTSVATITGVYDKGTAAVVVTESVARDPSSGKAMGPPETGSSSGVKVAGEVTADPPRRSSSRTEIRTMWSPTPPARTRPCSTRLCGDRNPLHSDPTFAASAGFPRPILHGLCTYGFTGRALMHTLCESDPDRVRTSGSLLETGLPWARIWPYRCGRTAEGRPCSVLQLAREWSSTEGPSRSTSNR